MRRVAIRCWCVQRVPGRKAAHNSASDSHTGLNSSVEIRPLEGRRVGIVSNPASIDAGYTHIVDAMMTSPDLTVGAIFGPQHGFRSDVQDNMIETPHANDCRRKVPVFSLYSETREPTSDMLRHVDVMVIDLQDIGARIYTYIYTMANCLRACARHGVDIIVCDRPNPIAGVDVEGPMLVEGNESFVGQFPIPMRHGMTIGELATFFNEQFEIKAPLEVVEMEGWSRSMYFDATGIPFVMPSPNIPTLDSAIVYPGTVLFEGTTASEARGTTRPFELVGAPWVEAERFAQEMNARRLPGVHFRPAVFEPTFQKHAKTDVRRLPDSRARSPHIQAGADRRGVDRSDSRRRPEGFRLAAATLRIRTRQGTHRYSGGISRLSPGDRCRHPGRRIRARVGTREQAVRASSEKIPRSTNRWPPSPRSSTSPARS